MTSLLSPDAPQEYRPPSHLLCAYCDKPIFLGDRAVYFHHGIVGRGPKSGQPMVTEARNTSGEAIVHELCIASYLMTEVVDSAEDIEQAIDGLTDSVFGVSYSTLAEERDTCAVCGGIIDDE